MSENSFTEFAPQAATQERETSGAPVVVRQLTKHYGSQRVLDGVSLHIPQGCVYGLLGRNGAGKSTLIKILLGMVHADAGTATLLGDPVDQLRPETQARVAYLAEGHPLYRWMTVRQAERFTRPFYPVWQADFFEGVLDHFRISARKRIGKLSNGQRAQVALALSLAPDPELLILDDPTLGLDTVVRRDFLESMIQLIHGTGRTIVFSSHILSDVERVADRVGMLVDGVLRADCPADHFKQALRKVVVEFIGGIPELPAMAGLVSQQEAHGRLELVIVDYGETQRAALESLDPVAIEVVEMNLEDAFIAYTRRPTLPLPALKRETVPC